MVTNWSQIVYRRAYRLHTIELLVPAVLGAVPALLTISGRSARRRLSIIKEEVEIMHCLPGNSAAQKVMFQQVGWSVDEYQRFRQVIKSQKWVVWFWISSFAMGTSFIAVYFAVLPDGRLHDSLFPSDAASDWTLRVGLVGTFVSMSALAIISSSVRRKVEPSRRRNRNGLSTALEN